MKTKKLYNDIFGLNTITIKGIAITLFPALKTDDIFRIKTSLPIEGYEAYKIQKEITEGINKEMDF